MTSLGDIIHTFPAVKDVIDHFPQAQIDWVVEIPFEEIVNWNPAIRNIIVSHRPRWRKSRFSLGTLKEVWRFYKRVRQEKYDAIIDPQGRIKSAKAVFWAHGKKYGIDKNIITDPSATIVYNHTIKTDKYPHVINRTRELFARSLDYEFNLENIDYGLSQVNWTNHAVNKPYLIFLHGTTWESKHWPDPYWIELAKIATSNGYDVMLPWVTQSEHDRAQLIAENNSNVHILERMNLTEVSSYIAHASGVVGVDTGLAHIAAAVGTPTLALYGGSISWYTGVLGNFAKSIQSKYECSPCKQHDCSKQKSPDNLYPPCFIEITPQVVWQELTSLIEKEKSGDNEAC